mmetsp:Transcript_82681/g.267686  ORF Transcript_82681/g.267686 Transcript_82681/m.267686 type:complete len:264 (-) Transcript_82681:137-928(-)
MPAGARTAEASTVAWPGTAPAAGPAVPTAAAATAAAAGSTSAAAAASPPPAAGRGTASEPADGEACSRSDRRRSSSMRRCPPARRCSSSRRRRARRSSASRTEASAIDEALRPAKDSPLSAPTAGALALALAPPPGFRCLAPRSAWRTSRSAFRHLSSSSHAEVGCSTVTCTATRSSSALGATPERLLTARSLATARPSGGSRPTRGRSRPKCHGTRSSSTSGATPKGLLTDRTPNISRPTEDTSSSGSDSINSSSALGATSR